MKRIHQVYILGLLPTLLVLAGLAVEGPVQAVMGLGPIATSPSILLHDYLYVGGLGATLLNAGLVGLICCALIVLLDIDINGPFIAAVYTVIGFCFFGKNLVNIWPIFVGVKFFANTQKAPFKNYALVAFFGTTLAPLGSAIAFNGNFNGVWSIPLAVLFGIAAGFVLPPLASHMLRFHDGYNIYNIGFTGGIIGSFFTALLRSFDFAVTPASILSSEYHLEIFVSLMLFFTMLLFIGLLLSRTAEQGIIEATKQIYKSSGRLVSDFTIIGDYPSTFCNMAVMGYLSCLFVLLLGGTFNGPVVGGVLTVVGFAAFGKHPRNTIPVLAGVVIASLFKVWEIGTTGVVIAGLFGTTLAPIAGQYGVVAGMAAGFFHLSIVMNVGMLHGGVNLYNNGFAGGFVASFLVPIIDAFRRDQNR